MTDPLALAREQLRLRLYEIGKLEAGLKEELDNAKRNVEAEAKAEAEAEALVEAEADNHDGSDNSASGDNASDNDHLEDGDIDNVQESSGHIPTPNYDDVDSREREVKRERMKRKIKKERESHQKRGPLIFSP